MFLISVCTVFVLIMLVYGMQNQKEIVDLNGQTRIVSPTWVLIVFAGILIITSTLRHGFVDTYAYKDLYIIVRNNKYYIDNAPWGIESGWMWLMYYLNYISPSPKLMLFMVAFTVNFAFCFLCKKYSCNPLFSFFIYFCIMFMDTNNGLRQIFAAALIMFAFPLLTKRKLYCYVLYALVVYVASLFHESAIYALIIAFVVIGKPFNIKIFIATLFTTVVMAMPNLVEDLARDILIDKYERYASRGGVMGLPRCLVIGIIPLVLAVTYYYIKRKKKEHIEYSEVLLLNFSVLNSVFYIMGALFVLFFARLAFYTAFAPILLIPKLIDSVFEKSTAKTIRFIAIACYFIFFAYSIYAFDVNGAMSSFYIEWFSL